MKFNKFISEPILLYTKTTMIATCSCRCGNNHRTLRCWNTHDLCCCTCHMDSGTSWLAGSVHDMGKFGRLVMGTRESPCTNCLLKIMIYDIHFEIIFVTSSLTFSVSLKWVTEIQWTFYNIGHAFTSRQCKFCWNDLSFTPTSNWILWIKFHLPSTRCTSNLETSHMPWKTAVCWAAPGAGEVEPTAAWKSSANILKKKEKTFIFFQRAKRHGNEVGLKCVESRVF